MSGAAQDWAVVWIDRDPGSREERTFHKSETDALNAACNPGPRSTALRIEGPGRIIGRAAIEQYCKSRPRRP